MVLAGDFNASFSFGAPLIGKSALNKEPLELCQRESARAQTMLGAKDLVVLNTFGKQVLTYIHPSGSSFSDYVMVRRPVADSSARRSCAVKAPLTSWKTVGHRPVVASLRLDWRPWRRQARASAGQVEGHAGGNWAEFKRGLERYQKGPRRSASLPLRLTGLWDLYGHAGRQDELIFPLTLAH